MILGLGGSSSKALPCPDPLATGLGDLVPETTRLENELVPKNSINEPW